MSPTKQIWKGRKLTISALNASDQARRMHEAVALRAYQIYESRGRVPGQELEDWRCAESEIVKPLSYGSLSLDNKLSLDTDASLFQEGELEIYRATSSRCLRKRACPKRRVDARSRPHGRRS
jgi:hypothetical protein